MAKKRDRSRRGRARRNESARQRSTDSRIISANIRPNADGSFPDGLQAGDRLVVLHPVRLPNGKLLYFQAAEPVSFNLEHADRASRAAVKTRRHTLSNLRARQDDAYEPADPSKMLDCIEGLQTGVVFSLLAVEAFANHWIRNLPDDATIQISERDGPTRKEEMYRLELEEKLKFAAPLNEGVRNPAGFSPWSPFKSLRRLRNDLLHPKTDRANDADPYGRLVLGEGDAAVAVAVTLIEYMNPEFIRPQTLENLGLERPSFS